MDLELSPLQLTMQREALEEKNPVLARVLSLKTTDKVGYLFGMGRLSEDNGMPTISHVFFTEALEELKLGTSSGLYQTTDVELAISRIELQHPGLVQPNVVKVHVESPKNFKSMIREVFQNTMVRSLSLLSFGVLIPFTVRIF